MRFNARFLLFTILFAFMTACIHTKNMKDQKDEDGKDVIQYDDTRPGQWPEPFELVKIPSNLDGDVQDAWFFPSTDPTPKPLLISLHTWSGDFNQKDTLAIMAKNENWNYIHPDFRGPNWSPKACCSEFALEDIDQAIDYAIAHGNVDLSRIYVIGVSGGGYAALAVYMRSRHQINTISAWVPISDLEAWYHQSTIRGNSYGMHIMKCTGSANENLNEEEARKRSPLFWNTPQRDTKLFIQAGVYDGIQGSVPITQSINFYNKLVDDMGTENPDNTVSPKEIVWLLEHRKPIKDFGNIGDRAICLQKNFKNIGLVIFEGNHEMLPEVAWDSIKFP